MLPFLKLKNFPGVLLCYSILLLLVCAGVCVMHAAGCCNIFFRRVVQKWGRWFSVLPPTKNPIRWKIVTFCVPLFLIVPQRWWCAFCEQTVVKRGINSVWNTHPNLNANQNKRIYAEEKQKTHTESNTNDGLFNLSMDNEELSWALILHAYRCEG